MPRRTSRTRRKRAAKRLLLLTALCILVGILLHYTMAPESPPGSAFDFERELLAIPEDQRAAVREKWQSLTKADRQKAQRTIQRMSQTEKQNLIDQLKGKKK